MSHGTRLEKVLARCRVEAAPEITGSPFYVMELLFIVHTISFICSLTCTRSHEMHPYTYEQVSSF